MVAFAFVKPCHAVPALGLRRGATKAANDNPALKSTLLAGDGSHCNANGAPPFRRTDKLA